MNADQARHLWFDPDPSTAGDFCRRFDQGAIAALLRAIDEARLNVWKEQNDEFFEEARIDADGVLVNTLSKCKERMDGSAVADQRSSQGTAHCPTRNESEQEFEESLQAPRHRQRSNQEAKPRTNPKPILTRRE